jgi:methionyl-tRNA formyltransferase
MSAGRSLLFLGSKTAGLRACRALCDLLPESGLTAILCPDDRTDSRCELAGFETLATERAIPLHLVSTRRETMALLQQLRPETAIVHGWYQILPVEDLPETLFLGFHYSPLPRYRGNAPLVWQIIQGEPEIGISFFELTAEMDAGRLVAQERVPLGPEETVADALEKADELVLEMLRGFVPAWLAGRVALRPQSDAEPSYCGLRLPEDGQIDWTWDAKRVHDFVRAQTRPYPGAFTSLPDGRYLKVWRSAPETRRFMGAPGAVVDVRPDYVVVAAGEGAVRLLETELAGSDDAPPDTLLLSLKTRLGR